MDQEQMREEVMKLPHLHPGKKFSWNFRRQEIRDKIMFGDIDRFTSWDCALEFLVIGSTPGTECRAESVGRPYGNLALDNQAYNLEKCIGDCSELDTVYELGSGYGLMFPVLFAHGFRGQIISQDFPEMHLLQRYFLGDRDDITYTTEFIPGDYDLFIANCSLSEVEEHRRPRSGSFGMKYCEICYQPDWGISNIGYFDKWKLGWPLKWTDTIDPCYDNHRHLIGVPK